MDGVVDNGKPISFSKNIDVIVKQGIVKPRPTIIAGIANVKAYIIINYTTPVVFEPRTLITPISNVLVSTETISKLYMSKTLKKNNSSIIILSVIPKNKDPNLNGYNSYNTGKCILKANVPNISQRS